MALEGLKGLTAKGRAEWEKEYSSYIKDKSPEEIERIYRNSMFKKRFSHRKDYSTLIQMSPEERDEFYNNDYDSLEKLKNFNINNESLHTVDTDAVKSNIPKHFELTDEEQEDIRTSANAYKVATDKYNKNYERSFQNREQAIKDIKTISENISPYYKKYKNTDYLPFTDKDWQKISVEYNANRDAFGDEVANTWLQGKIQDTVSENQSIFEKAWKGFAGMGASAAGSMISTAGMLVGAFNYFAGNHEDVEGLSGFGNFLDSVMDNKVTRYGNDVVTYGTIFNLDEAKKFGLSQVEVVQTQGQQTGSDNLFNQIFNVNTIPVAMQSGGFTVASMFTGFGEAQIANLMFRGIKAATMANKVGTTTQKLLQARKTLNTIQKAENFTNKFIIPGLVGTTEGVIEGLNTKIESLEDSKNIIAQMQDAYVNHRFNEIMELDPTMNPEEAYKQAWDEYAPKYKESLEQAEFAASKAGINNFLVNSAINGAINQTLKAGLQAPVVQNTLQKSRLFNWVTPKGNFNISGSGSTTTVTPKYGFWKQAWNIAKEPLGEFTEEYLQSVSDATMRGGATHNINQFIDNKYNGDGSAEVGDYMAGDFKAALLSMGEAMIDTETIKSGIYGAISSVLGTPTFNTHNYTKKVKGQDGKYHTKVDLSRREDEGRLQHFNRLMPWRSGISNALRENSEMKKQLYDDAKELENWLRDPNNKAKFDGLIGTYNWAKQMESTARSNDEFGYRNSLLGKTINDVFMLEKMKNTSYYDSFMKELVTAANLEEGSSQANDYIKAIKDNVNTNDNNVSDTEILQQIKSNANKMLNVINTIQQESDKIDRTLGNVDEDTKQALIFGQMSLEDWNTRGKQLESELKNVTSNIENSISASNITDESKKVIGKFGSLGKAIKVKEDLTKSLQSIQNDIENLNKRKNNLIDSEKKILKEKKVKLKSIKKELDSLKDINGLKEEDGILNEAEIMALPIVDRAVMLNKKNLSNYSEKQQEVINNLLNKGTAKDINFYNKIQDAGRMELAKRSFLIQYNEILRDPNSFNAYVQKAKEAASDVLTKKRFESISNISDYKEFALEMDKLMDNSSFREQKLIISALAKSNNSNYIKYNEQRKTLENLFNQIVKDDTFKDLDANDLDMFALSLQYLSNNDVDLNNESDVINALSKVDENNNSLFQKYVEDINANSADETKTVFTSIGEVIQTYKDVMKNYKTDEKEKANNAKPVEVKDTKKEESAPATPVDPTPEVSDMLDEALETSNESSNKDTKESSLEENKDDNDKVESQSFDSPSGQESSNPIEEFEENSNEEVAKSVELGLKIIENSSDNYSKKSKDTAKESLLNFSKNTFNNVEELSEALVKKANQLDASADEKDEDVILASNLLRQVASKIVNQAQQEKTKEKEDNQNTTENKQSSSDSNKTEQDKQDNNVNIFGNSGMLDSSNIQWLKEKYPNNPIVKYWKKYDIEHYLKNGKLETGKEGAKVYFITDDILANDIKTNKESTGAKYTNFDIPIIAVVEDKNGPLTIGNKKYQPIGTFPSTDNKYYSGVNNVGKIRDLVKNQNSGDLIRDNDGNILSGSLVKVTSKQPDRVPVTGVNINIQNLIFDTLSKEDQNTLLSIPKKDRNSSVIYKKIKEFFKDRLREKREINPSTGESTFKNFYIEIYKLKGKNDKIDSTIFFRSIKNTVSTKSGKLITDLFNENNVEELLVANSRLEKASQVLDDISNTILNSNITTNEENGELIPTGESANTLNELSNILTRKMNNHLHLPSLNWVYKISVIKNNEGKRVFHISVSDGNTTIPLTTISNNAISNQEKFDFFKNLIMEGNQTRKNGKYDFIKWQVDTPNKDQTLENVLPNLMTALDDGILELSHKSIEYTVQGIQVRSPFNSTGETVKTEERSNSDNATPSTSINTPTISANDQVQSGKAIIDSETGTVLKGEVTDKSNTKLEIAKDIANKIVEDSKVMKQDENGSDYINTKTGKRFTRITSITQAFDDYENPWTLPSTNIEAGIVDFIKDFFAGEFFENGKLINDFFYDYPNAANGQWKKLAPQFQTLKNSLDAKGINIIPKDFIITRTLNLSNSNGEESTVDVAEASVLLGYDQQGNFHIYGIKTFRDNLNQQDNEEYTKLLYSYSEFLKNTYGINIRSLNMIPIKVEYPEPNSNNEYTIDYANQLFLNDEKFLKTNIELLPTTELNSKESNINKNSTPLTKEEQEILNKAPRDSEGRLLAPNGKPSNLNERQYAQVRTKAFKRWFGDWINSYVIPISFMPKRGWTIGKIIDNPTDAANICDNTQIKVLNHIIQQFGKPSTRGKFYAKPVTIWAKSPINDKQIHHSTVAVRINGDIYLYDMPQSEYIKYNSENNGTIVKEYSPRFIEYTEENLKTLYGTSDENIHLNDESILDDNIIELPLSNASKVIDENGEPLVVIHNTKTPNITVFKPGIAGSIYFADKGGQNFVSGFERGDYNYEVFLNIRKPTFYTEWTGDEDSDGLLVRLSKQQIIDNTDSEEEKTKALEVLKDGEYAGFFAVSNPNQIKSATDNSGIFSTTNDDIYDTIEASVNQNSPEVTAPTEIKNTTTNNNKIVMDPNVGLNTGKSRDRRKQNKNNENSNNKVNPRPTRLIPSRLTWGVWEGFTNKEGKLIDVQQSINELSKFYTEEEWNQLSDEIMEKELICKGIY